MFNINNIFNMDMNDTFKSITILGSVVCGLIGVKSILNSLNKNKEFNLKDKELNLKDKELNIKDKELETQFKIAQLNNEIQFKITQLNNETQLKIAELQNTKS